jgi:cupin 2 domain-containing protein
MPTVIRGHLLGREAAPSTGELTSQLVRVGDNVIEQILSGVLDKPVTYNQSHDEWVVVLAGAAELEVNGERLSLLPGDWVLLPRHTPHRLLETADGTNWLAVHLASH